MVDLIFSEAHCRRRLLYPEQRHRNRAGNLYLHRFCLYLFEFRSVTELILFLRVFGENL